MASKKVNKIKTEKSVAKPKKVNKEFEKAVKIATWCTVSFAAMEALWYCLAYSVSSTLLLYCAVLALLAVFIKIAHDKENKRLMDALTTLMIFAVGVYELFYIGVRELGKHMLTFGTNFESTFMSILVVLMVVVLGIFVIAHLCTYVKGGSQLAIGVNKKVNFFVLLISACSMVMCAAIYGLDNVVLLVEALVHYGLLIFSTDLVQRIEEGK